MSPCILTSSPAGLPSSSLTSTASSVHLVLPTTSSEASVPDPGSSTPVPTHSFAVLPEGWSFPTGCSFPGGPDFSSVFANSNAFPTSWFSGGWGAGSDCARSDTPSSTSTSTSSSNSPSSTSATPVKSTLSTNAVVGIAVAAGVVAILVATGLLICVTRRRHRRNASASASASLLPVAYPIARQRRSRTGGPAEPSPPPSEQHIDAVSDIIVVGAEQSLVNCSVVPQLSLSSTDPPDGVELSGPPVQEAPCRAEKALLELRDHRDRRAAVVCEAAAPEGILGTGADSRSPKDVGARLHAAGGGGALLAGGQRAGQVVVGGFDLSADHSSDSDADSDSGATLPPPYSSHPNFG
ncbi:hypothetical protein LXA43DRAFT_1099240 [Ganoderma leucocontextum]|nr:hypothetical protein LXA43DRAFT_1099240 [Ganoderma leucocontextum]